MTETGQQIAIGLFCVAFIVICLRVAGLVEISRVSSPRAYWFGIACFALMVLLLLLVATWTAIASPGAM